MEYLRPEEIEKKSFEILTKELADRGIFLEGDTAPVIRRCIHTTADFDYAETLYFSDGAVSRLEELTDKLAVLSALRQRRYDPPCKSSKQNLELQP